MKILLTYNWFLIFLLWSTGLWAQSDAQESYLNTPIQEHSFDEQKWKESIKGIDYSNAKKPKDEIEEDLDQEQELGKEERDRNNSSSSAEISAFWGKFFQILFIVIAIIIIAIILINVLKGDGLFRPKSKKFSNDGTSFNIEEVEENIHESDLDRYIREAIEAENYPLAIRLYYLAIIKELSLKKMIKWKKDKTNRDYLRELQNTSLVSNFKEATHIFERVWYGDGNISENDFHHLKPKFQEWITIIKKESLTPTRNLSKN